MHSFLSSPATHAEPLDWTRLMSSALAVVKVEPSEHVLNALAMMSAYATTSPAIFTNLTRGVRDVKEYVALLTAFDDAVASWPLRLRQLLTIPPVSFVSAGAGVNGSLVTVPVRTARGEALVFLVNVAIGHVENGLSYLARVWADTATATSASTPQGGSVAAPNQNAKIAAQHFRQAVEALQWAESVHAAPASPSAVTLQQLHAQLPLEMTLSMAVLSAAVAKYMYALSSASTKNKPDVLAKLAFEAAQLPLPMSVLSSSSLQLLPSLLLAAYHYHQATWYYAHASAKTPEMAEALGHVRYADTLLRTCNAQWGVEEVHQEVEHESRQWWGRRLASFFTATGTSRKRAAASDGDSAKHPRHEHGTSAAGLATFQADTADVDDDGSAAPLRPATRYPHLHALLLNESPSRCGTGAGLGVAPPDVVQVYPYVRLLLHDVCAALQQYEKENRVVYFAKVATAEEVRRDVPDVATASVSETAVLESRASLFASLPSPAVLQSALAQQEEVGQAQQALSRALQRVENDGRRLSVYVTPTAALDQALDALEALLPEERDWASPQAAVAYAADAIDAAGNAFKTVAEDWQEAHDVYVGDRRPPHAIIDATMQEIAVWTERATAALSRWAALHIPDSVDTRAAFVEALVPRSAEMWPYLEQVDAMSRDVRDVLAAEPGTVTQAQVQSAVDALEKVKLAGTALIAAAAVENKAQRRVTSSRGSAASGSDVEELGVSTHYEKAEAAVLAIVGVLQEAPMVVAHVEHAAAQLSEMQQKAVVVPLERLDDVHFRPASADMTNNGNNSISQASRTRAKEVPQESTPSAPAAAPPPVAVKPAKRRISGLPVRAAATAVPSSSSTPSRKRRRPDSASDKDSDDASSVSSSQLADAEEVPQSPTDGATRAKVSGSLLQRMKANKAKNQQQAQPADSSRPASSSSRVAKKSSKTEKKPAKR